MSHGIPELSRQRVYTLCLVRIHRVLRVPSGAMIGQAVALACGRDRSGPSPWQGAMIGQAVALACGRNRSGPSPRQGAMIGQAVALACCPLPWLAAEPLGTVAPDKARVIGQAVALARRG